MQMLSLQIKWQFLFQVSDIALRWKVAYRTAAYGKINYSPLAEAKPKPKQSSILKSLYRRIPFKGSLKRLCRTSVN